MITLIDYTNHIDFPSQIIAILCTTHGDLVVIDEVNTIGEIVRI